MSGWLLGEGHPQLRHNNMGLQCWMDDALVVGVSLSLPATSKPCLNIRDAWILTSVSLIWWVPLKFDKLCTGQENLLLGKHLWMCECKVERKTRKKAVLWSRSVSILNSPALASGQQNLWQKCCLVAEGNKSPVVKCLKDLNWHPLPQIPLWWRNLQHNQEY